MASAIQDSEEWHYFFEQYKDLPELWQIKNESFKNRDKKKKAWAELLRFYQCIVPKATIEQLKSRINNIRTCYRRELKKISDSEKSGAGTDEVYVPSLWYFEHLSFLKDQEETVQGTSSMDSGDEGDLDQLPRPSKRSKPSKDTTTRDEFLQKAIGHLDARKNKNDHERDDAAIFAEGWACGFRKMTDNQQLCAKKAIDEIILIGRLGKLSFNMVNATFDDNTPGAAEDEAGYPVALVQPQVLYQENAYENVRQLLQDTQYG
nr:uncharacterized protein LOC115264524 [Aedes albopictus]